MTHKYKLESMDASSKEYGNCEVCGKYASEVFYQNEQRRHKRPDGSWGWTYHKCNALFGHYDCLVKIKKSGQVNK